VLKCLYDLFIICIGLSAHMNFYLLYVHIYKLKQYKISII